MIVPMVPVRTVVGNRRSLTGYWYSLKMRRMVPFESRLERGLFALLEWDKAVESYWAQPLHVYYRDHEYRRVHIPDALAVYRAGFESARPCCLYQVKYAEELLRRWSEFHPALRAASRYAAARNWDFRIATDREIRTPFLKNVEMLLPYRGRDLDSTIVRAILSMLEHGGPTPIKSVLDSCPAITAPEVFRRTLIQLCAEQVVAFDVSQVLTLRSTVWAA